MFVGFRFNSFTQFEYQLTPDVPNISRKILPNMTQTADAVSRKKFIYLVIPYILSANSEQTHHTLSVSYLTMRLIRSGIVCWLLIWLAVDNSYNKSLSYIALALQALFN